MESNYKRLGDYIELVTETNDKNQYGLDDIVGVTIDKKIIPTIANLKNTELLKFTIVKPKSFIYNPRTHGKKIGLGYNNTNNTYIATWNNNTFKIKKEKENELNSDYLYMCFCRDIWDKEACFNAWGSSTVVLKWEDFCNMKINIPDITEQEKIVRQYKAIEKHIDLLNNKTITLANLMDRYFCNVFGEYMLLVENYTENTDVSILPEKWEIKEAQKYFDISIGKTPPREIEEYFTEDENDNLWFSIADMKINSPYIIKSAEKITTEAIKNCNMKIVPKETILLSFKMTVGRVAITDNESLTNEAIAHFKGANDNLYYTYLYLKNFNYNSLGSTSSISTAVNSKIIKAMPFLMPDETAIKEFTKIVKPIFKEIYIYTKEIDCLEKIKKHLIKSI